jgi:hypothetical protein
MNPHARTCLLELALAKRTSRVAASFLRLHSLTLLRHSRSILAGTYQAKPPI